uniref:Putative metalloprotease n=1 Tax=Ixodes ricinus TaxID=34613 RepID=A0A0K8RH99_IXORI
MWNECLPPRNNCIKDIKHDHFIMHPSEPGNGKFSNCSKEHMIAFISTLLPSCFELKTKQNCSTEMKELPGVSMNLTKICKLAHPNFLKWNVVHSQERNRKCRFDCCSPLPDYSYYPTCVDHPLPDGADCGDGKRCVKGTCGYYDEYGTPTAPRQSA